MHLLDQIKNCISKKNNSTMQESNAYSAAKDWHYERYEIQEVMANRWQLAFWVQVILSIFLVIFLITLLPLKTWQPIIIHRNNQTGEVWVENAKDHALPETNAEVESDLTRYVVARETFAPIDVNARYQQVLFSSSNSVAKSYENIKPSLSTKTVKVQDIVFLDSETNNSNTNHSKEPMHKNLAKVDFVTTENDGQKMVDKFWVATMSWDYLGTPDNKTAAWVNWNGFTVTYYRVDQRNV